MGAAVHRFDFTSPAFKRDPFPTFARMRALGPVVRSRLPLVGNAWLTTDYEATSTLLKNTEAFATDPLKAGRRGLAGVSWWMPRSILVVTENMLLREGADHRRLRQLVDKAFQRQSVAALRPRIEATVDQLLDGLEETGGGDLMARFARPLPLAIICELLGLPPEDRAKFTRWCAPLTTASSPLGMILALPGGHRLIRYLEAQFAACRRTPRPGMISALVEAEEAGDRLSENELLAMVFLLLLAGHETTTHLIGVGTAVLLQHPAQKERLMADWSAAPAAVDELLRFVSPVQFTKPRYAVRDVELHAETVKRGEFVLGMLAAANADPDRFDAPETLDLARSPNRHLAFGTGPHVCLGLQLARAEAAIAFERLFTRFPDARIDGPAERLRWLPKFGLRALKSLPVRVGEAS